MRHLVVDVECRPAGPLLHLAGALALAASSPEAEAACAAALASQPALPLPQQARAAPGPGSTAPAGAPGGAAAAAAAAEQGPLPRVSGTVPVISAPAPGAFLSSTVAARQPVVIRGLDIGGTARKWTPEFLAALPQASRQMVSAHVSGAAA